MSKWITKVAHLNKWLYYTGFTVQQKHFSSQKCEAKIFLNKKNAIDETKKFTALHNIHIQEI